MLRRGFGGLVMCLLALNLALFAFPAMADEREDAVKLANQGFDLMEQGKYREASDLFRQAAELYYSPVIALYWAKAEARQGKLLEAQKITQTIIDKPLPEDAKPSWTDAIDDARTFAESLERRIPHLTVAVKGPGAEQAKITIDDKPAAAGKPLPINPGSYAVKAKSPKGATATQAVELGESDDRKVELEFDAEPVVGGGPSLVPPLIAYGVGAAGLIVGSITGGIFIGKTNELEDACPNEVCPPDKEDLLDETTALGNVATVAWVIAGLGAAAGTVLLFVPIFGEEDEPAAALRVSPTAATVEVRF